MRNVPVRAAALIALSLPLGACNSFLGIHFARHTPRAAPSAATVPAQAAQSATAIGRQQLADGQTGLAIESFQRALASGEEVAPALNGMGVAYARLERFDLAQRYFQQAMASDPANPKYGDNLARLMRSPVFALRRESDIARAVIAASPPLEIADQAAGSVGRSATAAPAVGSLQRVSRGEVRIATVAPQSAPVARGQATLDRQFKPLVRIALGGAEPPRPQSFVRFELPQATPARAKPAASAAELGNAGRRR
jgi:tetratricopeptide (TPR) repeat protein